MSLRSKLLTGIKLKNNNGLSLKIVTMFNNYTDFINNTTGSITNDESENSDEFGIAFLIFLGCFFGRFLVKGTRDRDSDGAVRRAKNRQAAKAASGAGITLV